MITIDAHHRRRHRLSMIIRLKASPAPRVTGRRATGCDLVV
ncbi:MAG: hypothetical protein AAGK00_07940 [Pseudomonadota bacterium]